MSWNAEILKSKLYNLQQKVVDITDPYKKFILLNDIYEIKLMLNYKYPDSTYSISSDETKFKILDIPDYVNMVDFLKKIGPQLANELNILSQRSVRPLFLFSRTISDTDAEKLIISFLKEFDEELLDLYIKYKNENRIETGKNPFVSRTCCGKCFPILSEQDNYIYTKFNKKIYDVSVLCHELAHAKQYTGVKNALISQRKQASILSEAYPIFVQLCFWDYLKNTKYHKSALSEEGSMIDNFFVYIEYSLYFLYHVKDANFTNDGYLNGKGFGNMAHMLELLLSKILALYWKSLYLRDPEAAKIEVDKFNESYGVDNLEQQYNRYGTDELMRGLSISINDYKRRVLSK